MTAEAILTPIITKELEKHERNGGKIKLKTAKKRRIKYSIICGIIALCGFAHPVFFVSVPVYIILMLKTRNNINIILSLAKKSPNKPVDLIIAEEVGL